MPKHRSPILEHQNVDTWSMSDLPMENAKIAQHSPRFSPVRQPQPSTAMVDLAWSLETSVSCVTKRRRRTGSFFQKLLITYYHLLSLGWSSAFSRTSHFWRFSGERASRRCSSWG